jgi:hypothetical protein
MNLIKVILGKDVSSIVYKYLVVDIDNVKYLRDQACNKIKTFYRYHQFNNVEYEPHKFKDYNYIDIIYYSYF